MPKFETLEDIKKHYRDVETMPVTFIDRFLNTLYNKGKINRELCVIEPMTVIELENFLRDKVDYNLELPDKIEHKNKDTCNQETNKQYISENNCHKIEEEVVEFDKYNSSRLDQARTELHELWNDYEDEREKEIKFLQHRIRKIKDLLNNFFKITKISGAVLCIISTWVYLEYIQNPL
ncbi:hypothetical protein CDIK_1926 [Cucumispora dikerogammari]|nr:hypothetical protein CDIK_1926 [Cucumispora dikerogammari]